MDATTFWVARSLRLPGLGLLLLPTTPPPDWLAAFSLHTALALRLHRPGQPPLSVIATIEELAHADEPPARALLLDADPPGLVTSQAWLELLAPITQGLV
jgi:hypothetical protein